jgi:putative oxidoreductase
LVRAANDDGRVGPPSTKLIDDNQNNETEKMTPETKTYERATNSPRVFRRVFDLYDAIVSLHFARWAPIPLRLIVGYGFAEHGFAKLLRGADNFTGLLHAMGTPFPHLLAWTTIITEILGGVCVLLGAIVPLVSIPMVIILLVAVVTVHIQYGFSSIKLQEITPTGAHFGQPGYETDLLYLAGIIALIIGGSGPLSVDGWLSSGLRRRN